MSVTFIGAGPGPGLITVRGLEALRRADVILYDDLLDSDLLSDPALESAEKIFVGKRSGAHSVPQEETTALLISKANEGKRVARLKGGDSFVFGRGGEEALALQAAGIPFELVPGVSSAVAVPEDFGIPVTHRGKARSFTVVTGHTAADPTAKEENYEALAKLEGTLVFLMGLRNLAQICGELIENGKSPETPASVLSKGFAADAVRYDGTLETISTVAKDARPRPSWSWARSLRSTSSRHRLPGPPSASSERRDSAGSSGRSVLRQSPSPSSTSDRRNARPTSTSPKSNGSASSAPTPSASSSSRWAMYGNWPG